MTKPKARSRLQHPSQQQVRPVLGQQKRALRKNARSWRQLVTSRLQFLPLLLLASLFYGGVYLLVTQVSPNQVRNIVLSNSFLPFHAFLLPANFFFFTFLTLSKRWGLLVALAIQWLLFLKLQNFTLDMWAWGSAVIIGVSGYTLRVMWVKKTRV
ncbi:MAG TPA: hypothetical protein VGA89_00490 [Patescibacteria group bacterium]|jgi:hypothetical protein